MASQLTPPFPPTPTQGLFVQYCEPTYSHDRFFNTTIQKNMDKYTPTEECHCGNPNHCNFLALKLSTLATNPNTHRVLLYLSMGHSIPNIPKAKYHYFEIPTFISWSLSFCCHVTLDRTHTQHGELACGRRDF